MSRYKAYPEYKEFGVEMLGPLPASWATMQVRYLLRDGGEGIKIGPFGSALRLADMVVSGVRVYGQENVIQRDFSLGTRRISAEKFSEMAVYEVGCGDVLITMMGTSGKCILVPEEAEKGIIDSHLLRMRLNDKDIIPAFFRLLIDESFEIENQIKISGKGSIMHGLNSGIVKSLRLPLPGIPEQISILNFLDQETAKIDALIEKQQRLIEFLKEKRQAVISHAVTKGLNPNAPMKDSGVEWLGEVPAHWAMTKFHYEIDLLEGPGILADDFHDDGVPLLRIQNVKDKFVSSDYKTYLSPSKVRAKWDHFRVSQGDLIISCSATTGLVSEVGEDTVGAIPYTGLIRLRPQVKASITKEFIRCLVQSDLFFEQIKLLQSGSTIQHFGPYHLQQMHITLPTITEQDEIANTVKEKNAHLDKLVFIADQQIELMQERRTALISAAVTGKIDVRDWQAAA